ncbi:MAG: radical SAM protein [Planctomycetota bacterium]|nr:radical SAM protein [Planctomycetota bacterium]
MRIALVGAELEENLAVRYIRAALSAAGHDVVQIVFNSKDETERAAAEIAASGAALGGFSMVFTYRAREFAGLAARARELGFAGHTIAGGHFAAFNAEALLREVPAFDSVGIGEGENLLCELATHLHDLAAVRGLVWRDAAGGIVRNPPAAKPADLDALASPVRKQPPDAYLGLPIANMLSSRGCTHACAFCSIAAWHRLCGGERFRQRAPAKVAEELARLYAQGYTVFNFHDDNFFLQETAATLSRMRVLRRELRRRGVGRIAFAVKSRPDTVDRELFAFLKEMGLFRVFLGIEAGTAESLRRLGRGQTRDDNERALEIVNGLDLHACFNLLLLNPDSTLEDFRANVAFLRAHPHNPMNFCRTEIYSGTPLEARLRREGRLKGTYWGYDYEMRDPRAQRVFELIYDALEGRHYGDDCVQHLTMAVDYEHQLLGHFFHTDDELRRQVKSFTMRVNLNTCAYLEELADAADGPALSETARRALVGEVMRRAQADDAAFAAEGDGLLAKIRRAAIVEPRREWAGWTQKAAAVTLAASLALGATACGEKGGHTTEMVPLPGPERVRDPAFLRPQFDAKALPIMAQMLRPARDTIIEMQLDQQGRVVGAQFQGKEFGPKEQRTALMLANDLAGKDAAAQEKAIEGLRKLGPTAVLYLETIKRQTTDEGTQARVTKLIAELLDQLTGPQAQQTLAALREISFAGPAARGEHFVFNVSKEQLEQAWKRQNELTPPTEMAPMPPNTHPHERAPVPPAKKTGDANVPRGTQWTEEVAIPPWVPPGR